MQNSEGTLLIISGRSRVPVFVQLHSKSQQLYQGTFESKNLRTDFQMVHLKRVPPNCKHLSGKTFHPIYIKLVLNTNFPCLALAGLTELFKEKIGSTPIEPVELSVCWTYSLSDNANLDWENWPQQPPDFESMGGVVGNAALGQLGFGAIKDPIK